MSETGTSCKKEKISNNFDRSGTRMSCKIFPDGRNNRYMRITS